MTPRTQSKEDKVFSLVRNLKEYGYYKKDTDAASKLLRKAFPAFSIPEALEIIDCYSSVYEALSNRIKDNPIEVLAYYNRNDLEAWLDNKGFILTDKDKFGLNEKKLTASMAGFLVDWLVIR